MIKKLLTLFLSVMMIFVMASCGTSKETLIVVTEPTFPPFESTDDNNKIIGFDIDLINAIAEDQGFEVEFKAVNFDKLIPEVESGNADVIAAGMSTNVEERNKVIDFSQTYYDSGLVLLVKDNNNEIKSFNDLNENMKVASKKGTTGAAKALSFEKDKKVGSTVILDEFDSCVKQLTNGDVDAVVIDKPVALNFIAKQDNNVKIVGETLEAESYGFGVKKGNDELRKKINTGLENIMDSDKYTEIYDKWFK